MCRRGSAARISLLARCIRAGATFVRRLERYAEARL
jgi:hypothetical protein